MASLTQAHECEQTLGDSEGQEAWHAAVHGVAKSRTRLSDLTELASPHTACRILVFRSGFEYKPPAMEAQSPNY